MNALRRLKRSVARENMKKRGFIRVNKGLVSYFSEHWREFV